MVAEDPNLKWYTNISKETGLLPRCPFASVHSCPRYYSSLSLMGRAGSTSIPDVEDKRLLDRWKSSPLWPVTAEGDTSLSGGARPYFANFCPEVMYDRFGLFVSSLGYFTDEIDQEVRYRRLKRENVAAGHPMWQWESYSPSHYSSCPFFSPLSHDWTKIHQQVPMTRELKNAESSDHFDIFISHASEDKIQFVDALVAELQRFQISVWYDRSELQWGDSIRQKIDKGLSKSRFGIVVVSKHFISKKWTNAELDGLFARETQDEKVILPIRHGVTQEDIALSYPTLAGKLFVSSELGAPAIALQALDIVRPRSK